MGRNDKHAVGPGSGPGDNCRSVRSNYISASLGLGRELGLIRSTEYGVNKRDSDVSWRYCGQVVYHSLILRDLRLI
jgi:hypothetical protein